MDEATLLQQSYLCGDVTTPLVYETIGTALERVVARYPDREALVVRHQGIRWSYREYLKHIDRLTPLGGPCCHG